jgi:hypothetical protein
MGSKRLPFSEQLRRAIAQSDKTRYRISQETGISEAVLSRFMAEKVGLSMPTVDLLCDCLRLRLVAEGEPGRRQRKKG